MIKFKLCKRDFMFTHILDDVVRYDFDCAVYITDGVVQKSPKPKHYHKLWLGFYIRKESWLG